MTASSGKRPDGGGSGKRTATFRPDRRWGVSRSFIFSTRRSVTIARRAMSSLEWRYFSTNADSRLMSRSRTLRCLASDLARTSLASRYWVQVPL